MHCLIKSKCLFWEMYLKLVQKFSMGKDIIKLKP